MHVTIGLIRSCCSVRFQLRAEDGFPSNVETRNTSITQLEAYPLHQITNKDTAFTMTVPVFETTFAVPMTCEACIKDIEGSLSNLSGTSARSSPMHVIRLTRPQESTRSPPTSKNSLSRLKAQQRRQQLLMLCKRVGETLSFVDLESQTVGSDHCNQVVLHIDRFKAPRFAS